ncbi:MAG: glycosyltransferase [Chloroflexi bacterium]|nr:glycosyltransferase [Chloroflexota bacterium]
MPSPSPPTPAFAPVPRPKCRRPVANTACRRNTRCTWAATVRTRTCPGWRRPGPGWRGPRRWSSPGREPPPTRAAPTAGKWRGQAPRSTGWVRSRRGICRRCTPGRCYLACGAPVACSAIPALWELAGEAALYFDPTDPAAMAAAIGRALGEADLRAALRGRGLARAAEFSWERTARATLAVYRTLVP